MTSSWRAGHCLLAGSTIVWGACEPLPGESQETTPEPQQALQAAALPESNVEDADLANANAKPETTVAQDSPADVVEAVPDPESALSDEPVDAFELANSGDGLLPTTRAAGSMFRLGHAGRPS